MNLILDLDNTIVCSKSFKGTEKNKMKQLSKDYLYVDYPEHKREIRIFLRPGLDKFLDNIFKNFKVSVWSLGEKNYVNFICKNIIENKHRKIRLILNRSHSDLADKLLNGESPKDLRLVYSVFPDIYTPENTVIVDDKTYNSKGQKDNFIKVEPFVV